MHLASYYLFLFILIFSPLAFATVEPWSIVIAQFSAFLSFLLLIISRYREKRPLLKIPGSLPLFLLILWIALQMVPLPVSVLRLLSPATYNMYYPLIEADPSIGWLPMTLNPKATLLSFFKWASIACFYHTTIYHLKSSQRIKQTVTLIAILSSFIAIEAIIQKLLSPDAIYWFRAVPGNSSPVGPWVYSNQFAGFMEMVFPVIVALFLFYRPQLSYEEKFKDKLLAMFTMPGANRYLLLGSSVVLIAVSIIFSLSRGGIITLCLAFLFFVFLSARISASRRIRWGIVLSVCVVLIISWFGWQPIMDEFGGFWGDKGFNTSLRLPIFRDTFTIFSSFPIFGTGMGSFQSIFPAFRTIPGASILDHVHNDYLELLTEGGIVGFAICAWFITAVIRSTIETLFMRKEHYSILITCGALTGILALLFHSLVDFQMANGANAIYFVFLLGLAVSCAHTRLQYRSRPTLLNTTRSGSRQVMILTVSILLAISCWYQINMMRASGKVANLQTVYLNPYIPSDRLQEIQNVFSAATHLDPLEPSYHTRLGHVETLLNNKEQAIVEYLQALRLNPASGYSIQQLGLVLPDEKAHLQEKFLALGTEREPLAYERYRVYVTWLLDHSRRKKAMAILNQALITLPDDTLEICRFIVRARFNEREIKQILPDKAYAWHDLGRVMEILQRERKAERYYLKALDYFDIKDVKAEYFQKPYALYIKTKRREKAMDILRMGIEYLPNHPWFRIQLGDYYLKEGITYRAREEYLLALRFDPDNINLRRKAEKLSQNLESLTFDIDEDDLRKNMKIFSETTQE